jgi:transcriptional regulator with XRE-family HTH domain
VERSHGKLFGKNVNRLRMGSGLTQEQLAEKADISRRYLQEIEGGSKSPTIAIISRLRAALNSTWDNLLKGL